MKCFIFNFVREKIKLSSVDFKQYFIKNLAHCLGQRMCIKRLGTPVNSVLDAFVSVSIDRDLLTPSLTKELNPMSINIKSVKNLPDDPIDYQELRTK